MRKRKDPYLKQLARQQRHGWTIARLSRREKKQLPRLRAKLANFDLGLDEYHPLHDYRPYQTDTDYDWIAALTENLGWAAQRSLWSAGNSGDPSVGIQGYGAGPSFSRLGRMYRWWRKHPNAA
jgi:hypothetical protein